MIQIFRILESPSNRQTVQSSSTLVARTKAFPPPNSFPTHKLHEPDTLNPDRVRTPGSASSLSIRQSTSHFPSQPPARTCYLFAPSSPGVFRPGPGGTKGQQTARAWEKAFDRGNSARDGTPPKRRRDAAQRRRLPSNGERPEDRPSRRRGRAHATLGAPEAPALRLGGEDY